MGKRKYHTMPPYSCTEGKPRQQHLNLLATPCERAAHKTPQPPGRTREKIDDLLILLLKKMGDTENIVFKKGYFPETRRGLEDKNFSLVNLDVDLLKPTIAGMEFFYPRMSEG